MSYLDFYGHNTFIMKYKNYSSEIWERIENTLNQIKHIDPNPIAAFDADGTLWDTDLGEAFFSVSNRSQISSSSKGSMGIL